VIVVEMVKTKEMMTTNQQEKARAKAKAKRSETGPY
jgi:hypothetical protein